MMSSCVENKADFRQYIYSHLFGGIKESDVVKHFKVEGIVHMFNNL